MSKTTFLFSLIILCVAFLYWFDQASETMELLQSPIRSSTQADPSNRQKSESTTRPQSALPTLRDISDIDTRFGSNHITRSTDEEPVRAETRQAPRRQSSVETRESDLETRNRLFNEVTSLEQQVEEAKSELELRREAVESLKQIQDDQEQSLSGSSTTELNSTVTEIQNLEDVLEEARLAERDIDRNAEATRIEQTRAAQATQVQIDENIRSLQQNIQQTVRDINYWTQNRYDTTARDVRLSELRNLLAVQNQELESLRTQRVEVSNTLLDLTQNINDLAQQQRNVLIENQNAIQNEIINRREEIQNLQQNEEKTQANAESLNSQITQAQKSYNEQLQRVREIEKTLQEKRQQLRAI